MAFRHWIMILASVFAIHASSFCSAGEPPKIEPALPFRTDYANAHLPWFQLKPGQFPPYHSDHRVGGELVEADFIHRTGVFRMNRTGELVNFKLPPFGSVMYLNTEADLRDVPLGTRYLFFLYQDEKGAFTQVATMQDEYTMIAGHGFTYHLDEIKLDKGVLLVTKQKLSEKKMDLGHNELVVNQNTRVWKGDKLVKLTDLAVGDDLLVSLTGLPVPGRCAIQTKTCCSDVWIGLETHKATTEQLRKKNSAYLKERGLPVFIDHVDGKKMTITFISGDDHGSLQPMFKDLGIVPAKYAKEHHRITAAVANEELRTYNPVVDRIGCTVLETKRVDTGFYGCSGEQWVIEADLLLEGFRKGSAIRVFLDQSWHVEDMPFGQSLYDESPRGKSGDFNPNEYPYRTDFANESMPWYQLKPGGFPPYYSEHRVFGELVKADETNRTGQFRTDGTGELVDFSLADIASIFYLNTEAELGDVPLGTRMEFFLYQDDKGAFTKAAVLKDEYTRLASNDITYRLDGINLDEGKLFAARQVPARKNPLEHLVKPPDFGRGELLVDEKTRVWKEGKQIALNDLVLGDDLLVNLTGRTATCLSYCTEIWVGTTTHKDITKEQHKKHSDYVKAHGMPAIIEHVEGKKVSVMFFSCCGELLHGEANGKKLSIKVADDKLHLSDSAVTKMNFAGRLPEGLHAGTHGCSGVGWMLDAAELPPDFQQGRIIRVFKDGWPISELGSTK